LFNNQMNQIMESCGLNKGINRRKFIFSSIFTGLATLFSKKVFSLGFNDERSTIVVVEDSNVTNGTDIIADTVQTMVDDGIMALTGLSDVGEAWKSLMPGITASSIIAIKVNCRAELLPTHPEVTNAVTNGLAKMLIDGVSFPENNIHIYDNYKAYLTESGYTLNTSSVGVKCYSESTYSSTSYSVNGKTQHVASVVHDKATYLINIGVLKNHYSMAGASLCLKNHFGTVDSPREFHYNYGDPYIGALNAIEPIKSKHVLAILDCLFGAAEGGPYGAPTFVANKIIMSADTVAVDYLGRELLREQNSSTVEWATYIDSAADYGIGTNDPDLMDIIYVNNTTGITDNEVDSNVVAIKNYPNPFWEQTTFEFQLAKESEVCLEIYSSSGVKVTTVIEKSLPAGNHSVVWKGVNNGGQKVQKGLYVGKIQAGIYSKALVLYLN
jgi:uncharacterized protein (DUF362 family)